MDHATIAKMAGLRTIDGEMDFGASQPAGADQLIPRYRRLGDDRVGLEDLTHPTSLRFLQPPYLNSRRVASTLVMLTTLAVVGFGWVRTCEAQPEPLLELFRNCREALGEVEPRGRLRLSHRKQEPRNEQKSSSRWVRLENSTHTKVEC